MGQKEFLLISIEFFLIYRYNTFIRVISKART